MKRQSRYEKILQRYRHKCKKKKTCIPTKNFSIIKYLIVIFILVIQNCPIRTLIIGWDIPIGRSRDTSAKLVLESFMTVNPDAPADGLSFPVPLTDLYRITILLYNHGGRRGCDRMVVGFTTNYAVSAYHH